MQAQIITAHSGHEHFSQTICQLIEGAAAVRGTGISKREPEYIRSKINEGNAVIALHADTVIGFCYIESWEDKKYVANSGLIVHPDFRKTGLAKAIKKQIFQLSRQKYPEAKLFGITTSLAVMKINSDLGYEPVTFAELTKDEAFWKGCRNCKNYDILQRTERKMCLCTGMANNWNSNTSNKEGGQEKKAWKGFQTFMRQRKIRLKKFAQFFQKTPKKQ